MKQRGKSDATEKGVEGRVGQAVQKKKSYTLWYVIGGALLVTAAYFVNNLRSGMSSGKPGPSDTQTGVEDRLAHGTFRVQTTTTIREENGTEGTTTTTSEILLPAIIADYLLRGMNSHVKWKFGLIDWVIAEFITQ